MIAATRSEPECSASEMIAMDPEMMPTVSLKAMSAELDAMEIAAARDFSGWLLEIVARRAGVRSGRCLQ